MSPSNNNCDNRSSKATVSCDSHKNIDRANGGKNVDIDNLAVKKKSSSTTNYIPPPFFPSKERDYFDYPWLSSFTSQSQSSPTSTEVTKNIHHPQTGDNENEKKFTDIFRQHLRMNFNRSISRIFYGFMNLENLPQGTFDTGCNIVSQFGKTTIRLETTAIKIYDFWTKKASLSYFGLRNGEDEKKDDDKRNK